jgi:3-hydroxyacyl-CoA dehydrogenase/3a,7a,12a-trihydroxy-5b-cholest-24-enoyl-CoA hydratase
MSSKQLLFKGRTAVVSGCGGGIGREYALALARRGCDVVVNDVETSLDGNAASMGQKSSKVSQLVEEIRGLGVRAIGNTHSVLQGELIINDTIKEFGKIDIVINNAGILRDKSFQKMSMEEWQSVIDVHLTGSMRLTKAAWSHMIENKYGRVVNIGSSAGLYGNFGQSNYSAAKMAMVGLTNTLAIEGRKHGIHVNCVVPVANSQMTESVLSQDILQLLSPSHISPMVLFLSHDVCQKSGSIFEIGGGFYSEIRLQRSAGVTLGFADTFASPEEVSNSIQNIGDFTESYYPVSITDSLQSILAKLTKS